MLFLLFISQWANLPLCRLLADGKDLADGKAILGRQPALCHLFFEAVGKAIHCHQLADDKEVADGKSFDSNSVGCRRRPWLPPPTKEALLNLRRRPYAALPPLSASNCRNSAVPPSVLAAAPTPPPTELPPPLFGLHPLVFTSPFASSIGVVLLHHQFTSSVGVASFLKM
mgnify:CR=1 FL=1